MRADAATSARKLDALGHALGPALLQALRDPAVVEVLVNPDGKIFLDEIGCGRRETGLTLAAEARERAIRLIADHMGESVGPDAPRLAAALPSGERFQGMLPPVTTGPAFAIRKRPAIVFGLADYVRQGVLSASQGEHLSAAAAGRRNLLITGGAGSGKTTLANAMLAEPAFASDRIVLIEDTPELQCSAVDSVALLTRRARQPIGVGDLVRDALRLRPDRIIVGELRDGQAALEALKAWNTGHPGGLATLHANSAAEAVSRLEDLLSEVLPFSPQRLIAQAIDIVVHISRTRTGRRVEEIISLREG
jgi:type IV secretion system protein TrbB